MAPLETATSYDVVPYESHPYLQSHPDRLATVGTLLGLKTPRVHQCRVLELGCAAGGNIIPMAMTLPESTFVGIDLSSVQVADGQQMVNALELKNIELKHHSIMDVGPEFGKFDYIICHGVYSWVPNHVREKILAIANHNLAQNGIVYISYNTYPGWHVRGMIRDMLVYHARQFSEPATKIKQARNLLDFLAKSVVSEKSPYAILLKQELELFHRSSDYYLYHDHLEEVNEPVYFHQFAERAAHYGLKYLAEVDLRVMMPGNYPPEIENVLHMLSQDQIHLEQYMDFLRNRTFRQTLLCHKSQNPVYALHGDLLSALHVASSAKPINASLDIRSAEVEKFETHDGVTLSVPDPIVKAAMVCLSEVWPQAMAFKSLVSLARQRLGKDETIAQESDDAKVLGQSFLTLYLSAASTFLELYSHPQAFSLRIGERPEVSKLARRQAETQSRVTNFRHDSVFLGEFERRLVRFLDGTRERTELISLLADLVTAGELNLEKDGQAIRDPITVKDLVGRAMDIQLQAIARNALLVK